MRIAILTPGFSASESDWCIPALLNFVRGLAERHEVTVFSHSYPNRADHYNVYGAAVRSFGITSRSLLRRLVDCRRAIIRCHKDAPFDVVHSFFAGPTGALGAAVAGSLHLPCITTVMGGELMNLTRPAYGGNRPWLAGKINRYAMRRSTRRAALSASAAELFNSWGTFLQLPFGVDLERFEPTGATVALNGSPRLLMAATLVPIKGHEIAFDALKCALEQVDAPQLTLHLVGGGDQTRLKHQVQSRGLCTRVMFHGHIPHHELPAYYRGADALLVPSVFETQSLAALEAAACGCPVIGSRVGIIPELVAEPLTVPVNDVTALARLLRHVAESSDFRQRQGPIVRQIAAARFDLHDRVADVEDQYHQLVAEYAQRA